MAFITPVIVAASIFTAVAPVVSSGQVAIVSDKGLAWGSSSEPLLTPNDSAITMAIPTATEPVGGWAVSGTSSSVKEVIMAKLQYLMTLPDGWDGPDSRAVTEQAATLFEELVTLLPDSAAGDAEPMATPDGGLRMEWDRGAHSYVVELLGTGGMYLCSLDPEDNDDDLESDSADIGVILRFFQDGTIVR